MDVKEAVASAKAYVNQLFKDQMYSDPALEEVAFDNDSHIWQITIGFLRQPDKPRRPNILKKPGRQSVALDSPPFAFPRRAYKVVRIKEPAGEIVSVRDRD